MSPKSDETVDLEDDDEEASEEASGVASSESGDDNNEDGEDTRGDVSNVTFRDATSTYHISQDSEHNEDYIPRPFPSVLGEP